MPNKRSCQSNSIPIGGTEIYDIVGPICETGDFLAKQRSLAIKVGDLLAIRGAGAYGFVMSSNYNSRPRCAEIMVDGDQHQLVRQRESLQDLFALENHAKLMSVTSLPFFKMHALGNDFMIMGRISQWFPLSPAQIKAWADRHTGIGFDQLLLVDPAQQTDYDFFYRIYNADGSESEQCGNGARCIARFVQHQQLSNKTQLHWQTIAGSIETHLCNDNQVRVNMGIPQVSSPIKLTIANQTLTAHPISIGNPHIIIFVDNLERFPFTDLAPLLQHHPHFKEPVNVNFAQVIDQGHIKLIVYERGAGFTQACGSGACATLAAARTQYSVASHCLIEQPGGQLNIEWQTSSSPSWLTGPATFVFDGKIYIN